MYKIYLDDGFVWFMVFNATFNNISDILWQSVLLVEETGVSRENRRPVASHWQTWSYNVVSSTLHHELYLFLDEEQTLWTLLLVVYFLCHVCFMLLLIMFAFFYGSDVFGALHFRNLLWHFRIKNIAFPYKNYFSARLGIKY